MIRDEHDLKKTKKNTFTLINDILFYLDTYRLT